MRKCEICGHKLAAANTKPVAICLSCRGSNKPAKVWVVFLIDGEVHLSLTDDHHEEPGTVAKTVETSIPKRYFAILRDLEHDAFHGENPRLSEWDLLLLTDVIPTAVAGTVHSD